MTAWGRCWAEQPLPLSGRGEQLDAAHKLQATVQQRKHSPAAHRSISPLTSAGRGGSGASHRWLLSAIMGSSLLVKRELGWGGWVGGGGWVWFGGGVYTSNATGAFVMKHTPRWQPRWQGSRQADSAAAPAAAVAVTMCHAAGPLQVASAHRPKTPV